MPSLLEHIESFNRKERFFLIGEVLGNPIFRSSAGFRKRVGDVFGLDIPVDALVLMDYHLDWIHASLALASGVDESGVHENEPVVATGTQEDIDLLIAFDEEDTTHLLMLEAKATTGWTNRQTLSKAKRLAAIFGPDGTRFPSVRPHFGLLSPRCPQHLRSEKWPAWMTINDSPVWLKLPIPRGRRHLTRTDAYGRSSAAGTFFRVFTSH